MFAIGVGFSLLIPHNFLLLLYRIDISSLFMTVATSGLYLYDVMKSLVAHVVFNGNVNRPRKT